MTPPQLAMMYAMNVGIEALQGKRGSNLWKDAFKDTALMASLQGMTPEQVEGADKAAMGWKSGVQQAPNMRGVDVGFQKALSHIFLKISHVFQDCPN